MDASLNIEGVDVLAPVPDAFTPILTPEALGFAAALAREFEDRRQELLKRRLAVQEAITAGQFPDFLEETREIRAADWKIAPVPEDLQDRRVEITGPVDRKMVINAFNSGAKTYMADFEDSHAPTWAATIQGQQNLIDAVNGTITFDSPAGKHYELRDDPAVLIVRPRGWHLPEKHVSVDGRPISGSLFDFALFFFHNARTLIANGSGPYFYLPKLESHLEARLWNDVFKRAQDLMGIARGTIKATVLIETILAAFETEEIIYELRDHMAGLNCGRWDYIFSFIKKFSQRPESIFPDRAQVSMTRHCMHSYSLQVIKTCHRRGAHAMGGMAAQIPIKSDPALNAAALARVREDKIREATDGHDGTWVAHPGLVSIAMEEFNRTMPRVNQIDRLRENVAIRAADLLKCPGGTITEEGLRSNISVGVQYMASWLSGNGCVPLYNLMEDAATAEISRTQVWQWVHHPRGILADGRPVDIDLFKIVMKEEMTRIQSALGQDAYAHGHYDQAATLFDDIITRKELDEFLTLRAYEYLD
ncbi:MAG: malate synthase A [Desulfosarcina sp.]|nr:malate synthase A [Desulfobacterales bacterium]